MNGHFILQVVKILFVFTCFLLFNSSNLLAKAKGKSTTIALKTEKQTPSKSSEPSNASASLTLNSIQGETDNNTSFITIRLNQKPTWQDALIEDHGTFLQIALPNTFVAEPGKFYEGNSQYFKKMVAFQLNSKDAAVRVFVSEKASLVKASSKIDILNDLVVLKLDHTNLQKSLSEKSSSSVDSVISSTEVNKSIPEPAKLIQDNNATPISSIGSNVIDLRSKLTGVSIFSGIMLLGLLIMYFLRPIFKKSRKQQISDIPMIKTLTTYPITAKQKLALIQVGNEKFLLAVSSNSVSFLSAVGVPPSPIFTQAPQLSRPIQERLPPTVELKRSPLAPTVPQTTMIPQTTPAANPIDQTTETLHASSSKDANIRAKKKPAPNTINVAVGDQGVIQNETLSTSDKGSEKSDKVEKGKTSKAIEDVTWLIREKLKNLPSL